MTKGNITVQTENIFPIIKKFLYSDHEIFLKIGTAGSQFLRITHQHDTLLVAPNEMGRPGGEQNTATGGSGCAQAVHHDPDIFHP